MICGKYAWPVLFLIVINFHITKVKNIMGVELTIANSSNLHQIYTLLIENLWQDRTQIPLWNSSRILCMSDTWEVLAHLTNLPFPSTFQITFNSTSAENSAKSPLYFDHFPNIPPVKQAYMNIYNSTAIMHWIKSKKSSITTLWPRALTNLIECHAHTISTHILNKYP